MVFSSLIFIYLFLPLTMLIYFCVPVKYRNAVLLGASLIFYFCGEQLYLLLMLFEITLTYVSGRLMEKSKGRIRKAILVIFLILSFGLLGFFKYADLLHLPLPIGISFYVFQSAGYGIDVYRRKYPAEKNFLNLALYVSFFPQLIAGPIVRFETVRENLRERKLSLEGFESGILRFCIGLAKKVLIADRLFAFCTSAGSVSEGGMLLSWAEGLAYLLYVYYDFSGYSDMAIGLAKCFGFSIPENFNYPLISGSFREFWRRWHISLGSWFRDYLYFPLGGSRAGKAKHIRNLLIVWALTGLWHGASPNFLLWGLGFGVLLVCEAVFKKKEKDQGFFIKALKHVTVMTFTVILFVFFRYTNLNDAIRQLGYMFGKGAILNKDGIYLLRGGLLLLILSFIGATPVIKILAGKLIKKASNRLLEPLLKGSVIIILLTFTTAYLVDGSFSPFLYFRF